MWNITKGAIVMSGFISQALSVLLKENDGLIAHARNLGGVVACRPHHQEHVRNCLTGETTFVWQVEFQNAEDLMAFDIAVRGIVDAVTGEER